MSLWSTSQSKGLRRSRHQWRFNFRYVSQWDQGISEPTLWLFPSSKMHNCSRHNQQLAESPHWFPDLWNEGHYGGKGQVEATRTASTQENNKPIAIPHPQRDYRDPCHHQGCERCRGGDSHHILIQLAYLVCAEDRSQRMTVDYCKLNQVLTPITTAIPDIISSLKQINTTPGSIWYAAIDLANAFSPIPLHMFAFSCQGQQYTAIVLPQGYINSPALYYNLL